MSEGPRELEVAASRTRKMIRRFLVRLQITWQVVRREVFFINLVLLMVWGVLVCWWLIAFTDLYPVVGGLLGLGGAFAWLGFVSGLLSKSRKEELQRLFDEKLLAKPVFTLIVVVLGSVFLIAGPFSFGTIEYDSTLDTMTRTVEITQVGGQEMGDDEVKVNIPSSSKKRMLVYVMPFGTREYKITASKLPSISRNVSFFQVEKLVAPQVFTGIPVVLVRPTWNYSTAFRNSPGNYELHVDLAGQREITLVVPDYDGRTVWIGCDDSVGIPERMKQGWEIRYGSMAAYYWSRPIDSDALRDIALAEGDAITCIIYKKKPGGGLDVHVESSAVVTAMTARDWPLELVIGGFQ